MLVLKMIIQKEWSNSTITFRENNRADINRFVCLIMQIQKKEFFCIRIKLRGMKEITVLGQKGKTKTFLFLHAYNFCHFTQIFRNNRKPQIPGLKELLLWDLCVIISREEKKTRKTVELRRKTVSTWKRENT